MGCLFSSRHSHLLRVSKGCLQCMSKRIKNAQCAALWQSYRIGSPNCTYPPAPLRATRHQMTVHACHRGPVVVAAILSRCQRGLGVIVTMPSGYTVWLLGTPQAHPGTITRPGPQPLGSEAECQSWRQAAGKPWSSRDAQGTGKRRANCAILRQSNREAAMLRNCHARATGGEGSAPRG